MTARRSSAPIRPSRCPVLANRIGGQHHVEHLLDLQLQLQHCQSLSADAPRQREAARAATSIGLGTELRAATTLPAAPSGPMLDLLTNNDVVCASRFCVSSSMRFAAQPMACQSLWDLSWAFLPASKSNIVPDGVIHDANLLCMFQHVLHGHLHRCTSNPRATECRPRPEAGPAGDKRVHGCGVPPSGGAVAPDGADRGVAWRAEARAKPWAKIAKDGDVFVKSFSSQHPSIDPA